MTNNIFFILGAIKSGTTSLYHYIGSHPDICMSQPKETPYFIREFDRGKSYFLSKYFSSSGHVKMIGEGQNDHLFLPFIPERIKQEFPDAKLIISLRDPVERAISQWWEVYNIGLENLSFRRAISSNFNRLKAGLTFEGKEGIERWNNQSKTFEGAPLWLRTYLDRGYYPKQILRYYEHFPAGHIKIITFQSLISDTDRVIRDIWRFLGVNPKAPINNVTPRRTALSRIGGFCYQMARKGTTFLNLSGKIPEQYKETFWQIVQFMTDQSAGKPEIPPDLQQKLRNHFQKKNKHLKRYIPKSKYQSWFSASQQNVSTTSSPNQN